MRDERNKPKVLLCEDMPEFIKDFMNEMQEFFQIETCDEIAQVEDQIEKFKPDILILDLYWPLYKGVDRDKVNGIIKEFNDVILRMDVEVRKALEPAGLDVLREIRRTFTAFDLPVLIYTRAGQYVLDSEKIWDILSLDAYFLLKKYSPTLKRRIINRNINMWRYNYDVFISYAVKDANIAEDMKESLESSSLRVFMAEKTIETGEKWEQSLRQALTKSRILLLLLTPNSVSSKWVMAEAGAGWALEKIVMAGVMFLEFTQIPEFLRQFQCCRVESATEQRKFIEQIKGRCGVASSNSTS